MTVTGEKISDRLKLARTALALNQKEFASNSGVGFSTYQKYEMGMSVPGGDAIEGFIRLGINANWLLTGEGEKFLVNHQLQQALAIDVPLLVKLIEEMDRAATQASISIPAKDKGEMIAKSYADIIDAMSHHESRLDAAKVAGGYFERIAALYKVEKGK